MYDQGRERNRWRTREAGVEPSLQKDSVQSTWLWGEGKNRWRRKSMEMSGLAQNAWLSTKPVISDHGDCGTQMVNVNVTQVLVRNANSQTHLTSWIWSPGGGVGPSGDVGACSSRLTATAILKRLWGPLALDGADVRCTLRGGGFWGLSCLNDGQWPDWQGVFSLWFNWGGQQSL